MAPNRSALPGIETGFHVFAFRLHQFISRGDNVYTSLDPVESRHITLFGQQFVPGDRKRILLPVVFCRECGQGYYCVRCSGDRQTNERTFLPRDLSDRYNDEESEAGFLYFNSDRPWPEQYEEIIERIPDDWLNESNRLRSNYKKLLPEGIVVGSDGKESEIGILYHYIKAPFRFCPNCGVSYGVLRQLISDPCAFASIAKAALNICHFEPETGNDLRHAPRANEACEATCYDCLMNYTNQRDHTLLDRMCIRDLLLDYASSSASLSGGILPRKKHLAMLLEQSETDLERRWLHFINDQELHLPTHAQKYIEPCKTRPDFFYEETSWQSMWMGLFINILSERKGVPNSKTALKTRGTRSSAS